VRCSARWSFSADVVNANTGIARTFFCEPNRGVAIRRMSFWQLQRYDDGECASSSVSPTATENRKIESVFLSDFITVVDNWRLFRWRVSTWKRFSRGPLPTRMWSKGDTGSFRAAHRMSNGSSGWTDDLRQHRDRKSARDRLWAFALNVVQDSKKVGTFWGSESWSSYLTKAWQFDRGFLVHVSGKTSFADARWKLFRSGVCRRAAWSTLSCPWRIEWSITTKRRPDLAHERCVMVVQPLLVV